MMNRAYAKELRGDTSILIIPIITFLTVVAGLFLMVGFSTLGGVWHYLVMVVVSPLAAWAAWRQIKQEKQVVGGGLFTAVHLLLLTLVLIQDWQPNSLLPYLFAIFVAASSMMIAPIASFTTWAIASGLMITGVTLHSGMSFDIFLTLIGPIVLSLVIAAVSYLSALEWQTAVESVAHLHRRAQERRDELFQIQEALSHSNARLQFLNEQLELARQEAVNERDIRTRFMNNVSHELRTPLNAIVNFAHILSLGGRGPVNEMQADYLGRVEQAGWHLLYVLNDLLDMAQITAGVFKLHLETADLHHICEEAMTNTRGLILDKPIELIRDYPPTWPLVRVDKIRIKQALINLLGNAAKYTEEGHITLRVHADEQHFYLTVADTGIGIAPEYQKIIFQEFRQVDETAARKRIGTGLGLPITRHLIERHGGTITLESTPGVGSKFTITLPIAQEKIPFAS